MVFDKIPLTRLIGLATGVAWNVQRIAERALKPLGLTYAQFGLLAATADAAAQSQRELAARLETDTTTVMVVLDALEKKGFVERCNDPSDRRIKRIYMTEAGVRVATKAMRVVRGLYSPMLEEFTQTEVAASLPLFERMFAYLKERSRQ